jgi:phosphoserine phosphatase
MVINHRPARTELEWLWDLCGRERYDVFITPEHRRRKKLLIADMDATIVTGETLDELAEHASLKGEISTITARAMRGELDFKDALRERVKLLKDLEKQALEATLSRTKLSNGARVFVRTMANAGALCVLVSGGFTFFTGAVAAQAGFHLHHGNLLGMRDDRLTGLVMEPILDKGAKLGLLNHYREKLNIPYDDIVAIGDGANDLPMLQAAGLGIGYHPKPLVKDAIDNCVIWGDMTAALYAQGFRQDDFVLD